VKDQDHCPACGEGYVEGKRGNLLRCVTCAARFEHDEYAPTEAQREQRCELRSDSNKITDTQPCQA